jgi:hypothetical protein
MFSRIFRRAIILEVAVLRFVRAVEELERVVEELGDEVTSLNCERV